MYKEYLALNNLQWLICHKIQPNQTKPNHYISGTFIFAPTIAPWLISVKITIKWQKVNSGSILKSSKG